MLKKNNKEQKNWIIFISILVVSIILLLFLGRYFVKQSNVDKIDKPIKVSLTISTNSWSIEYKNISTKNNTVYKLLLECADYFNFTVESTQSKIYNSVFIDSINGTKNRENNQDLWWQYYVNGEYGLVGCDIKELYDGDLIEWKFETSKQ